jgi:hyperosmotically inducible periplasmic protein
MQKKTSVTMVFLCAALLLTGWSWTSAAQEQKSTVEQIRKQLLQLPYYGVFDFLAFQYEKGTVTLVGFAYRPTLKTDATRAVKRVPGIDNVIDKIEELPVSINDDELRWKTYYKIYGDPFLSRYAPGGGMLWGHMHPFDPVFHPMGPAAFPGFEPAGDYPIHIIVKNGKIALYGVVDNEADRNVAELRAREVPGSFGVENYLVVESKSQSTKR